MLAPLTGSDPRVVGRFQLQGRLGAGGMGVVYLGFGPGGQSVRSSTVPPPPGLTVSSDQWDRITTGGWIPDANVYSATTGSVAPTC